MSWNGDIVDAAKRNSDSKRELVTGSHSQLVVMSVPAGEEIGTEVHEVDQALVFVQGQAEAILDGSSSPVDEGDLVFVPAGTTHNFRNVGSDDLKLYTIYAPREVESGTIYRTKEEADAAEEG